jgi:Na+/proline symporter
MQPVADNVDVAVAIAGAALAYAANTWQTNERFVISGRPLGVSVTAVTFAGFSYGGRNGCAVLGC